MRHRAHICTQVEAPYKIDADQQDPHNLENLLVGVDSDMYAARDSNPEPAG
jgi:hypothetical protein